MDSLLEAAPGGYTIREAAPILAAPEMDKTIQWFSDTLGWKGDVDLRDEEGRGTYGCMFLEVPQAISERLRGFHGIRLKQGAGITWHFCTWLGWTGCTNGLPAPCAHSPVLHLGVSCRFSWCKKVKPQLPWHTMELSDLYTPDTDHMFRV